MCTSRNAAGAPHVNTVRTLDTHTLKTIPWGSVNTTLLRELAYKKRAWKKARRLQTNRRRWWKSCLTVSVLLLLLLFFWPGGIFAISHPVQNQRESKLISTKVVTLSWFTACAQPIISARRCIILLCKQTTTLLGGNAVCRSTSNSTFTGCFWI